MSDTQFVTSNSRLDCVMMPVEPLTWYGIRTLELDDDGIYYEWVSFARGVGIENLHRVVDSIKATHSVRYFIWIVRLSDKEAKELGL